MIRNAALTYVPTVGNCMESQISVAGTIASSKRSRIATRKNLLVKSLNIFRI